MATAPSVHSQEQATLPDYLLDVALYRPAGLIATALGSGVFLVTLPMTAVANLFPPYDAIPKAGEALVLNPAQLTFVRALGEPVFKSSANDGLIGRRDVAHEPVED